MKLDKSDMVPGLTAEQWSRPSVPLGKIRISLVFISGAAYFASGSSAETIPPWLFALFAVTITNYFIAMFILFTFIGTAHREAKAGYTTTGGIHAEVPQIESLTGDVLREVGEDLRVPRRSRPKGGAGRSPWQRGRMPGVRTLHGPAASGALTGTSRERPR